MSCGRSQPAPVRPAAPGLEEDALGHGCVCVWGGRGWDGAGLSAPTGAREAVLRPFPTPRVPSVTLRCSGRCSGPGARRYLRCFLRSRAGACARSAGGETEAGMGGRALGTPLQSGAQPGAPSRPPPSPALPPPSAGGLAGSAACVLPAGRGSWRGRGNKRGNGLRPQCAAPAPRAPCRGAPHGAAGTRGPGPVLGGGGGHDPGSCGSWPRPGPLPARPGLGAGSGPRVRWGRGWSRRTTAGARGGQEVPLCLSFPLIRPMGAAGTAPRGRHFALIGFSPPVCSSRPMRRGGWLGAGKRGSVSPASPGEAPPTGPPTRVGQCPPGRHSRGSTGRAAAAGAEPRSVIVGSPAAVGGPRGSPVAGDAPGRGAVKGGCLQTLVSVPPALGGAGRAAGWVPGADKGIGGAPGGSPRHLPCPAPTPRPRLTRAPSPCTGLGATPGGPVPPPLHPTPPHFRYPGPHQEAAEPQHPPVPLLLPVPR